MDCVKIKRMIGDETRSIFFTPGWTWGKLGLVSYRELQQGEYISAGDEAEAWDRRLQGVKRQVCE